MATTPINDNIQLNAPKLLDNKCGVFSAGVWRPYNDLAEFLSSVNVAYRAENLTFYVRSTTNVNRADLYILDKNKSPYKLFDDIDLSNYYTKSEVDEMFGLRDLEIGINADDIVTERNRAIAAEALKANSADIKSILSIKKTELTGNTYTNLEWANQVVSIYYYDDNGLQKVSNLTFSDEGVLTIPFVGEDDNWTFDIFGVMGAINRTIPMYFGIDDNMHLIAHIDEDFSTGTFSLNNSGHLILTII